MKAKIFEVYAYPAKARGIIFEEFDRESKKMIFFFEESAGSRRSESDSILSLHFFLWGIYPGEDLIFRPTNR
jgi:hypothetical protein